MCRLARTSSLPCTGWASGSTTSDPAPSPRTLTSSTAPSPRSPPGLREDRRRRRSGVPSPAPGRRRRASRAVLAVRDRVGRTCGRWSGCSPRRARRGPRRGASPLPGQRERLLRRRLPGRMTRQALTAARTLVANAASAVMTRSVMSSDSGMTSRLTSPLSSGGLNPCRSSFVGR